MVNSIKTNIEASTIGFNKSGFGCCSRFDFCNMGKSTCFYNEIDPEVKNLCAAYTRNHKERVCCPPTNPTVESVEVEAKIIEHENGQFSLF